MMFRVQSLGFGFGVMRINKTRNQKPETLNPEP